MSLFVRVIAFILLICFVSGEVYADASSGQRGATSSSQTNFYDNELAGQDNGFAALTNRDLLDALLTRPDKRQWCRKGMTYNHVLGSCTLSFAAMRGRGRRQ